MPHLVSRKIGLRWSSRIYLHINGSLLNLDFRKGCFRFNYSDGDAKEDQDKTSKATVSVRMSVYKRNSFKVNLTLGDYKQVTPFLHCRHEMTRMTQVSISVVPNVEYKSTRCIPLFDLM